MMPPNWTIYLFRINGLWSGRANDAAKWYIKVRTNNNHNTPDEALAELEELSKL